MIFNRTHITFSLLFFSLLNSCSTARDIELVNVKEVIPNIKTELWYATPYNFTKQMVYPSSAKCYLRWPVVNALKKAQKELNAMGLGFKIWDAYRPHRYQFVLWDIVPDPRYVGDPQKGSRHNYGCAVDLTLIDLRTGEELEMPTEFDNFTQKAWRTYMDLPEQVLKNRQLLEDVMTKYGFIGLKTEWWHFDYVGWEQFEVLDIDFDELD